MIYICGRAFFLGGGDSFWAARIGEFFREEKHKGIGEESNCNQGCPGMLLVILGIITHIRFLRAFVSGYLIVLLIFVWTKRATICFVEVGYLPVCLVLILDVIYVFGSI